MRGASRLGHCARSGSARGRRLCKRRSSSRAHRNAAAALQALAQGSSASMGKHAGVMRASAPQSTRRVPWLSARARRAGGNGVEPAHDCRVDDGLEMPFGQRSLEGTRRDGALRRSCCVTLDMAASIWFIVAPNAIIPALKVNSKKQVLQELAAKAAELCGQSERTILEILQQREKLGSTGVGNGIAIPHGKLPKLSKLFGLFARLERPVEFEALDGQPVDLVFLLLAPEAAGADHLKALARVARLLRDADVARKLRDSRDADALYAVLAMPSASAA